jgi:hypothetical protein
MAVPQLKQETFFLIAWILMAASVFGSLINIVMNWAISNIGIKISMVSGVLFNLLLTVLFLSMWVGQKKTEIKDNPELDEFIKSLQKGG